MTRTAAARTVGVNRTTGWQWLNRRERGDPFYRERTRPRPWALKVEIAKRAAEGASHSEIAREFDLPNSGYVKYAVKQVGHDGRMTPVEPDAPPPIRRAELTIYSAIEDSNPRWRELLSDLRDAVEQEVAKCKSAEEELRVRSAHADILEKSTASRSMDASLITMKTAVVIELEAVHSARLLLRLIGLGRSTYYHRRQRATAPLPPEDPAVSAVVGLFKRHHGRYGYRRITNDLRNGIGVDHAISINAKKVLRILKGRGLQGRHPQRKPYTSFKGGSACAPNLLNQNFQASRPCEVLVTDISVFNTKAGKSIFPHSRTSIVMRSFRGELGLHRPPRWRARYCPKGWHPCLKGSCL